VLDKYTALTKTLSLLEQITAMHKEAVANTKSPAATQITWKTDWNSVNKFKYRRLVDKFTVVKTMSISYFGVKTKIASPKFELEDRGNDYRNKFNNEMSKTVMRILDK
jgi:hypothetical protein